ncbi:hypothetical protein ACHAWC_009122 [Mediolabrus comicus]
MAYQSASRPAAQESYGADNDAHSSSNIGLSNSARGEGTSLPEMVAKLRFFNCTVCAYIIVFHILPILLNPIKLALVLKSPIRLILEIIVTLLSVALFTTESRMPIFAEKLLHFLSRKCRLPISTGGNRGRGMKLLDLDVARGRVVCITVMTLCIGMVNHLNSKPHSGTGTTASNNVDNVVDNDVHESMINGTNSSSPALFNETTATAVTAETATGDIQDENNNNTAILGFLSAVFYSTVFSVTMWFLLTLLVYNLYVMKEYPSYAEYRAFPHVQQQRNDDEALSPTAANSSRRSWVSNITDFSSIRSAVGGVGGGYQSVDNPIQMNV